MMCYEFFGDNEVIIDFIFIGNLLQCLKMDWEMFVFIFMQLFMIVEMKNRIMFIF